MLTDSQLEQLREDPPKKHIKTRSQGGRTLSYVEAWYVINRANEIFGYNWSRETVLMDLASEKQRKVGESQADGWGVTYVCKVRVTIYTDGGQQIIREGFGTGHGIDRDPGIAHESAAKEAESDATKRALVTLGPAFGLNLYDKDSDIRNSKPTGNTYQGTSPNQSTVITEAQVKRFNAIASNNGWSTQKGRSGPLKAMVKDICGVDTRPAIPKAKYETACEALTNPTVKAHYEKLASQEVA